MRLELLWWDSCPYKRDLSSLVPSAMWRHSEKSVTRKRPTLDTISSPNGLRQHGGTTVWFKKPLVRVFSEQNLKWMCTPCWQLWSTGPMLVACLLVPPDVRFLPGPGTALTALSWQYGVLCLSTWAMSRCVQLWGVPTLGIWLFTMNQGLWYSWVLATQTVQSSTEGLMHSKFMISN